MTAPQPSDKAASPEQREENVMSLFLSDGGASRPVAPAEPAPEPEVVAAPEPPEPPTPDSATPADEPVADAPVEEPVPVAPAAPPLVSVVVDGETREVPFEELKAGYSFTAHNTRKAQQLADERRKLDAEAAQVRAEREQLIPRLKAVEDVFQAQVGPEPDWERLRTELSPADLAMAVADYQIRERKVNLVRTQRLQEEAKAEADRLAQKQARLAAENEKLLKAIPEWRDPAKRAADIYAIEDFAMRTYGRTKEDLDNIENHEIVLMLRDAMNGRGLTAKPKLATPLTPVVMAKPGVAAPKPKTPPWVDARQRLAKSGNIHDAEAALLALLESGSDIV